MGTGDGWRVRWLMVKWFDRDWRLETGDWRPESGDWRLLAVCRRLRGSDGPGTGDW